MPVQISVNGLFSDRFETRLPTSLARLSNAQQNSLGGVGGGVRLLASPTLKFNERWFAHATFQLNTQPFFAYEAYHVERPLARGRLIQGYLGYTRSARNQTLTVKAGQMITAFGDFSRRYSDTANPLIDMPQPYGSYLLLRPDELPCTNFDLQHQQAVHPNISAYHCAPWESYSYGILPVSPYGVFGAEVAWNVGKWDARFQVTNSSPSNPQSVLSRDQSPQWAAGLGFSGIPGLRVAASAFRGEWLSGKAREKVRACPRGEKVCRCRQSSGQGVDVQYARGRFSWSGEWMRLEYGYPGFSRPPSVQYAYVETKVILTPRLYVASRIGGQRHGRVMSDGSGHAHELIDPGADPSAQSFQPNKQAYEVAVGFRPTRHFLFKVGQQWVRRSENFGPKDHVFAIQMVTSLPDVWKGFSKN